MEKFIPYEKLSKKKKRERDAVGRTVWTINPVTRRPASPKAYNRKKAQKWKDDSVSVPFLLRCDARLHSSAASAANSRTAAGRIRSLKS